MSNTRPQFVVSDLHLGDKGPRDNFAHMSGGWREQEFNNFLDYVESENGELTIAGDLFELWQSNISKVLTCRMKLMDRLASMGTRYLLGNHDIDLLYLTKEGGVMLDHPLFADLKLSHTFYVNGRRILLIHGHEQDIYCMSEVPGIGRASAIYSGLREDRNGGPLSKWKYGARTVEARSLGHFDRCSRLIRRFLGRPNATQVMRQEIYNKFWASNVDALIYGHTHEPGQFARTQQRTLGRNKVIKHESLPIYNTGTWAEEVNTFACIDGYGEIGLFNWADGLFKTNSTTLSLIT